VASEVPFGSDPATLPESARAVAPAKSIAENSPTSSPA